MNNYAPLKNLSHFSLRQSIQKPNQIVSRCKELGYTSCGLTDVCTLAGSIEFQDECKKAAIKPIFGLKLNTTSGNISVLARNKQGWLNLIKLVSKSNDNIIDGIPHTTFSLLEEYGENLIGICGGHDSMMQRKLLDITDACNFAEYLKGVFSSFYLDADSSIDFSKTTAIREIGAKTSIPIVVTAESTFSNINGLDDYKILVCSDRRCTLKELGDFTVDTYLRSPNQLAASEKEIDNSAAIASECETYSITNKPKLPRFECPDGLSEREYLDYLVVNSPRYVDCKEYDDRLGVELPVLREADLAGYFLIVNDYTRYGRSLGGMALGRGSSAGSLVSYLLELTVANPLTYNLLFERFYNSGRNTKDHVSYPDIDMDFPRAVRDKVIEYIRDKYGHDKVAQLITYGRMQGAGAAKEVLRAHSACDVMTMNAITENIPDEASIADDLENDDEDSIIRWVLHNRPHILNDYARLDDKGVIVGDYAQYIEQAIRIEGVYRTSGKHAAGIVIAPEPLDNICPMVMDSKGENKIVGMDMKSIEKLGLIKMDILGVAALDKLQYAQELIRGTK